MHAPTFAPVAEKFRKVLAQTRFEMPRLPYVPNIAGEVMSGVSPNDIRACLTAHVCEPVLWQGVSIDAVAAQVPPEAHFLEVGLYSGSVLHNLLGRGWTPGSRSRTDVSEQWSQHIRGLAMELGRGG